MYPLVHSSILMLIFHLSPKPCQYRKQDFDVANNIKKNTTKNIKYMVEFRC